MSNQETKKTASLLKKGTILADGDIRFRVEAITKSGVRVSDTINNRTMMIEFKAAKSLAERQQSTV